MSNTGPPDTPLKGLAHVLEVPGIWKPAAFETTFNPCLELPPDYVF